LYIGDEDRIKGGVLAYQPYQHSIVLRGSAHRVNVSPIQLLQWYARRKEIRDAPLPYKVVENAVIDLLNKPLPVKEVSNGDTLTPVSLQPDHTLRLPIFDKHRTIRRNDEDDTEKVDRPHRIRK